MKQRLLQTAALAAAMLFAPLALAQQDDALMDPATDPGAAPEAEIRAEHQDWVVRCQPAPEDAFGAGESCEMYQQVSEQETGQTVLETVIGFPPGADQPVALFNLPLGMLLPPGVQLQVNDNEPIRFAVQLCVQSGCRADIVLEPELVEQMRAGSQATLTIADPQGQGVELPLSLMGFSASLDDVEASVN
ncbi:invasion associated locus B family protein [Spiribacter sp. 2438]|uniref:invasion associated locus B family protein n=1 Tax=Spiribacter sp. 2438 TaxID=2666185 RepID=UPI0012B0D6A2|nr:invasion associated locus B family protein [Spiribacter sp. 2438]QGM21211.1 invasion associated locus B family protein [Spiribacter sp. 2438]